MCVLAGYFRGITALDLSFSSLNHVKSMPTFHEYIKRDKALRSLNLNCCKLSPDESTARLLLAIGGKLLLINTHLDRTLTYSVQKQHYLIKKVPYILFFFYCILLLVSFTCFTFALYLVVMITCLM